MNNDKDSPFGVNDWRRLLRTLAKGEEITQDTSTLENPAILDQLKHAT